MCKSDTRYAEKLPPDTFFVRFAKPGWIKDGMTEWQKNQHNDRTLKAKRWIHACGRREFTVDKIKNHTYICSLHFIGGKGPTPDHPDPIKATMNDQEFSRLSGKRRAPKTRNLPVKKTKFKSSSTSTKTSSAVDIAEPTLNDNISNLRDDHDFTVTSCGYNIPLTSKVCLNNDTNIAVQTPLEITTSEKETQTVYGKYILGAKVETMMLRNFTLYKTNT